MFIWRLCLILCRIGFFEDKCLWFFLGVFIFFDFLVYMFGGLVICWCGDVWLFMDLREFKVFLRGGVMINFLLGLRWVVDEVEVNV